MMTRSADLLTRALALLAMAMLFQPAAHAAPSPNPAPVDPATIRGLPAARDYPPPSDIAYRVADIYSEGVRLTAQWFSAKDGEGRRLPTVIMAPGWGATAAALRPDAAELARAGFRVLLFDYRGWGDSDGRVVRPPGGADIREVRGYIDPWEQAEDWFNAISYAAADPAVDPARIGLMGGDLAGGHVVYAAAHDPRVKAVVSIVGSFDLRPYKPYQADPAKVIADAEAAAAKLAAGGAYPAERSRAVGDFIGAPVGAKAVRWAPVEVADAVTAPSLFVLAQNEELFANANNGQLACERVMGPRKLMILPKITHYGVYGAERARTLAAAIDWFDRRLKPPGAQTRRPINPREPERGECFPPPEPPKGEEDPNGSGPGRKAQDASTRFN